MPAWKKVKMFPVLLLLPLTLAAADPPGWEPLLREDFDGGELVDWRVTGGESSEDYAGRRGRGYAKILEELWTEVSPNGAENRPSRRAISSLEHRSVSGFSPDAV